MTWTPTSLNKSPSALLDISCGLFNLFPLKSCMESWKKKIHLALIPINVLRAGCIPEFNDIEST